MKCSLTSLFLQFPMLVQEYTLLIVQLLSLALIFSLYKTQKKLYKKECTNMIIESNERTKL